MGLSSILNYFIILALTAKEISIPIILVVLLPLKRRRDPFILEYLIMDEFVTVLLSHLLCPLLVCDKRIVDIDVAFVFVSFNHRF